MGQVSTIGLDIAKRVFQVHGVDEAGKVVLRRQLRRTEMVKFFAKLPPCLVGLEACASAHYWGREITALGHQVRLMPPTRVKPYVKWGKKNDKSLPRRRPGSTRRPVARG
jgi:transposase